MKSRVLKKIEKFGLGDDGDGDNDSVRDDMSDLSPRPRARPKEVDLNAHVSAYYCSRITSPTPSMLLTLSARR